MKRSTCQTHETAHALFLCENRHAWVCLADDVLHPGNQLSLASAAGAPGPAHSGSRHGACHLQQGEPCPLISLSLLPSDPSWPSPVCLRNTPANMHAVTPLHSCHPALGQQAAHFLYPDCLRRRLLLRTLLGLPASVASSPMLDVACIHAAACDVAIADSTFWAAGRPQSLCMMASLCGICKRAQTEFQTEYKSCEADSLMALMDFQWHRLLASRVRILFPGGDLPMPRFCLLVVAGMQGHPFHAKRFVQQLC